MIDFYNNNSTYILAARLPDKREFQSWFSSSRKKSLKTGQLCVELYSFYKDVEEIHMVKNKFFYLEVI